MCLQENFAGENSREKDCAQENCEPVCWCLNYIKTLSIQIMFGVPCGAMLACSSNEGSWTAFSRTKSS